MDKPLISIITVTFNAEKVLEETIQSVIDQDYMNTEHIIIDGGSTDGTLEIIEKYADYISYWKSEPDNGLYDAMNKGIAVAKGDWLNFLNAGDNYVDTKVLSNLFISPINATVVYGDINVLFPDNTIKYHQAVELENDESIMFGMKVCHQAIFYHKSIIHPYDSSLKLKAEWKHLVETTRMKNFKSKRFNLSVVYYRIGGMGAIKYNLNHREFIKVFLDLYGRKAYFKNIFFFMKIKVRCLVKDFLSLFNYNPSQKSAS